MNLLSGIGIALDLASIKLDPCKLNSDNRIDKQNRPVPDFDGESTRFSYRDEHFLPMEDDGMVQYIVQELR